MASVACLAWSKISPMKLSLMIIHALIFNAVYILYPIYIALTVKKKRAMHTKYGVLCLSRLEHLICVKLRQIFYVCFTPNWVCFHTNSVCFPTNFSVFSHSLWRIFTLTQCAFPLTSVCFPTHSSVFSH